MGGTRRYTIEGETVEIPLCWDERTQSLVEDYGSVIEHPIYTPSGQPILLTIEDACPRADMVDDDPASIDCGSCRHYRQFPGSLLGVCGHMAMRRCAGSPETEKAKDWREAMNHPNRSTNIPLLRPSLPDLEEYVRILEEHLKSVKDPLKYKKMKKLDREARLMIHDLKQMKLLNRE